MTNLLNSRIIFCISVLVITAAFSLLYKRMEADSPPPNEIWNKAQELREFQSIGTDNHARFLRSGRLSVSGRGNREGYYFFKLENDKLEGELEIHWGIKDKKIYIISVVNVNGSEPRWIYSNGSQFR